MLAFVAISSSAFGQSEGTKPYPGATHNYSVTENASATYSWAVYKKGDLTTDLNGSDATITSSTAYSTDITWASTLTAGDEYIVVVTETLSSGCSNSKALPVIITTSTFDLVATTGGDACYKDAVQIGWTGGQTATDVTYTHGVATVTYTVTATGVAGTETWSFAPVMTYDQTGVSTSTVTVSGSVSGSVTAVSGVYTLTGAETATVTVVADNVTAYDNTSAADAQDYTATMTLSNVSCGTGSIESDTTNNADVADVARPATSGITAN